MKEIINRLQENRQIELAKSILESNGYRVLKESWPPILNSLSSIDKNKVRRALINTLGVDIEHTPTETIKLSGARDPRIKDRDAMLIFPIKSDVRHTPHGDVGIWLRGEFIIDPFIRIGSDWVKLQQMSWKSIMEVTDDPIMIKFDADISADMKTIQNMRKETNKDLVKRYSQKELDKMPWDQRRRLRNLDKSGYVMNPNKYIDMLAELKIQNAEQILQDAKDTYAKLAQNLSVENMENNDSTWDSYSYIMREIPEEFKNLSKALEAYNAHKDDPDRPQDDWFSEHLKVNVTNAIKNLRELTQKAKKYLD